GQESRSQSYFASSKLVHYESKHGPRPNRSLLPRLLPTDADAHDYRDVLHVGQCTGVASWARCRACHLARASCAQSMACHGIIWPMLTLRPETPRCICGASSRPSDQAMISTPRWIGCGAQSCTRVTFTAPRHQ